MDDPTRGGLNVTAPVKKQIARTNHLLVIGIDKYKAFQKLNNAVRDAQGFRDVLLTEYQFEKKDVHHLFDEQATLDNMAATFDRLLHQLKETDNLVVYFSGHGELIEATNRGYWIPVDARPNVRTSYYNNSDLLDFYSACKAHHIFTIVDSCFSGALFEAKRGNTTVAERLDFLQSRWLLTAGLKEPVSDGSYGKNSPFAQALLANLKGNPSPSLWASDLCNRVLQGVVFNADKQTPRGEPLPGVGNLGGQFVFYKKDYVPQPEAAPIATQPTENQRGTQPQPTPNVAPPPAAKPATFAELKVQFKMQIAEDLAMFFEEINDMLDPASRKYNDFILQRGSFNGVNKGVMQGTTRAEDAQINFNRIRFAMTDFIDRLKDTDLKPEHRPGA